MKNTRLALVSLFVILNAILPSRLSCYDLSRDRVQYIVTTSHLDTQWLWTIMETRRYYLPLTTQGNFYLFEKYPDYVFNYESAYHYMLIKDNYPDDFERIKYYVDKGNWHLSGGMIVACDVNVPNPESLVRQFLYGNGFFEQEFGRRANDVFLPDCFGFGYALPTVAVHCGMIGFSTQKVFCPWLPQPSASVAKPFDIGMWQGVDGSELVAAMNPGSYVDSWDINETQIDTLGLTSGIYAAYDYMGTGDKGGACCMGHRGCTEQDVQTILERIAKNDSFDTKVVLAPSDQLYRDLTDEQKEKLVRYRGEFLAREHGVGTYTSMGEMKKLNRLNEMTAFAAEQAALMAHFFANSEYPTEKLRANWVKFLWHQMHDDLTGTSIDDVYLDYSLPDEREALKNFSDMRRESLVSLAGVMDTRVKGVPVLVHNPVGRERIDPVEAAVVFPGNAPEYVRVFGPDGKEVISQILGRTGDTLNVAFIPGVQSCAVNVYDIRPSESSSEMKNDLQVNKTSISNDFIEVTINSDGDIASLKDKQSGREYLSAPLGLELFNDVPNEYPQWEIRYQDIQNALERVAGPAVVNIVENGPVRAVLQVKRSLGKSTFIQNICLAANGKRVDVQNEVDWWTTGKLLKASFPLIASSPTATYDLQLGVIERKNNTFNLYEVPGQQWADITDSSGKFGLAVLNDCKYGWDKPADNTLRLTLIHTPVGEEDLDIGNNEFTFSLYPHENGWREADAIHEAARLNHLLTALQVKPHEGKLGKEVSMLNPRGSRVALMSLKKSEKGNRIVVRLREMDGEDQKDVRVGFPGKISGAWELNGMEDELGEAQHNDNNLKFSIGAYSVKTFAIELN